MVEAGKTERDWRRKAVRSSERFIIRAERLRAGTSLAAGATVCVSCLLCRISSLPKTLNVYLRTYY